MSSFDAEEHRRLSLDQWEGAASGWERWQQTMRDFARPVSQWMVDALGLKDGDEVLDVAAGVGDTGLLAAQGVLPDGRVVIGDQAEAMVAAAMQRAAELGLENVDIRQLNAEWLDLRTASFDGVLCRWGVMLMADPGAALREFRRVLRPGGQLALAVWDGPQRNPWASELGALLVARGLMAPPSGANGYRPGMFALADQEALTELIGEAGFLEIVVESLPLTRRHASFAEFFEATLDMSPGFHDAVMSSRQGEIATIAGELQQRLAPYTAADGSLAIPAATLVLSAEA